METKTLVNLNTAEKDELAQVPGIGPVLAERIVEARPFASLDDARRVSGIGPSTLDKIAPYITVEEALLVETEAPAVKEAESAAGSLFAEEMPIESAGESRVTEIPADLIPLPPLPVVPPWDEETALATVEEPTTPEVVPAALAEVPPPLPEATAPALTEIPSPLEEATPSPLPEVPPPLPEVVSVASPLPEAPTSAEIAVQKPIPQPQAAQPGRAPTSSKPVTRGQLAWVSFAVFVATLIIALALSLGILAGINGGLNYASPREVTRVSQEVAAIKGQASVLEQSLNSVQTRLNNLEALSERVQTLETAKGDMQRELDTLTAQAKTLGTQVQDLNKATEALSTQMEEVQAKSSQFQKVMEGLRDLLTSIFPNP
jgi:prefoldin subunit 5